MKIFYYFIFLFFLPIFLIYILICLFSPIIVRFRKIKSGKEKIYIVKDLIHSDYVFTAEQVSDLFEKKSKFLKVGWGDRKIFLETKRWSNLKIEDFIKAFFGLNKTVLRIENLEYLPKNCKIIMINEQQLKTIKEHIKKSFSGLPIKKSSSDHEVGEYYESKLQYNCLTNCNNWVNYGLLISEASNKVWCPLSIFL